MANHSGNWPPAENTLAQEFAEQFSLKLLSSPERLIEFAKGLGIDASLGALPDEIRGLNCSMGERTVIVLSEQESFPGSREHTFFHELREIMEYQFRGAGCPTARGTELERRAEQFAGLVRMAICTREFGPLFEKAQAVERTWARVLAFAGLLILALGVGLGCALLPHFEENFPMSKSR